MKWNRVRNLKWMNNLVNGFRNQMSVTWIPMRSFVIIMLVSERHAIVETVAELLWLESQKLSEPIERSTPPALLTANPPVGISNRPTAIVAPAGPTRSLSAFFSSKSSVKEAAIHQFQSNDITMPSSLIPNSSSAFQPIHSIQNLLHRQASLKTAPVLLDIPQHKPLEGGEELHHVHISHPQSPSIVHVGSSGLAEGSNGSASLVDVKRRFQYGVSSTARYGCTSWSAARACSSASIQVRLFLSLPMIVWMIHLFSIELKPIVFAPAFTKVDGFVVESCRSRLIIRRPRSSISIGEWSFRCRSDRNRFVVCPMSSIRNRHARFFVIFMMYPRATIRFPPTPSRNASPCSAKMNTMWPSKPSIETRVVKYCFQVNGNDINDQIRQLLMPQVGLCRIRRK